MTVLYTKYKAEIMLYEPFVKYGLKSTERLEIWVWKKYVSLKWKMCRNPVNTLNNNVHIIKFQITVLYFNVL